MPCEHESICEACSSFQTTSGFLPHLRRQRQDAQAKRHAEVDWRKVKRDERYDGKFLLWSNTQLSLAEIGLGYKELWRIEHAFRELKTGLEIRPVYYWTPSRVRGHFGVCFLALVMESTLARMLREKRHQANFRQVLEDLRLVTAAHLELDDKPFFLRMELQG